MKVTFLLEWFATPVYALINLSEKDVICSDE